MRTIKLQLTSHYLKTELIIKVRNESAVAIMSNDIPIELIRYDCERVHYGYEPLYISKYQAKKIDKYLTGYDYFDKVEQVK